MGTSGSGTITPITISGGGSGTGVSLDPSQPLPRTLLPLARYAQIMQINLPHFQQMNGPKAPLRSGCDDIWDQNARELLAWTMQQAEELIAIELGYYPAPKFITSEQQHYGRVRGDWWNAELKTDWGYVENFGTETLTLVQADATVQYLSLDNNPNEREETARIGNSLYGDLSSCSRACDVAVFFRVADGAEDAASEHWEIRPIKVDIDGSTMRITADSALFIKPGLWSLTQNDCAASDDSLAWRYNFELGNLVSAVDVYCRTVNTTNPLTLQYPDYCTDCTHLTSTGCAYPTDAKRGFFTAQDTANTGGCWQPESVLVNYRAGLPLDSRCQMNPNLERAIVKLTNVLLPEPPCGYCDIAKTKWENDRKNIDPLTPEAASMPWDLYAQGALEAWRIVKKMALGRGGKL